MQSLPVSELVSAVRISLDEIRLNPSLMAGVQDTDSDDLDTIIESKIVEAVTVVHRQADIDLLTDAPAVSPDSVAAEGKVLLIQVPQDMLRFVALKVSDSYYTVCRLIREGSHDALRQGDIYACGTYERPEAVLRRGNSTNTILYYSLREDLGQNESADEKVELLSYLTVPAIEDDAVEVCSEVKDAVISMLTGLVLTVFKDEHATRFYEMARMQMGVQ